MKNGFVNKIYGDDIENTTRGLRLSPIRGY